MFMAGLEVDPRSLLKVGKPAIASGVMGVIVPMLIIVPTVMSFDYSFERALFVGILLASMSTSISAQVMLELGVLQKKEGLTMLGAALVDDAVVILSLSLYIAINPGGIITVAENRSVLEVILRIIGFLAVAIPLCWIFLPRIAQKVYSLPIAQGTLMVAIVSTLLLSFAAEYFGGVAAITGAFIAGLSLGRSRHGVLEQMERGIHAVNYGLLVPLFFVSIGLRTNLRLLTLDLLPFALVITFLAILTKIVGAGGGSIIGGFERKSAMRVGLGMISRGEVGLIIASIGVRFGILQAEIFTVVVFVVLVTTMITPPLVRWSFREQEQPIDQPVEEPTTAY
jgi:Kef-type K+ transport system membrane component KefB